jgi:hypothetical protein
MFLFIYFKCLILIITFPCRNLTFCNIVNMEEKMTYTPHPEDLSKVGELFVHMNDFVES